ncbi:flagellar basal-body rod protein FlgG [Sphingomonas sp. CGMCC 1.13654]|uniref:Flagellar basal-body rod protein FlgG n=1 Tax=Sphingomonas chungangi TaxID=2683589 RepID=A0A838L1K2_9SPHN|nr:flagellar basal-body rod protein FlgG [Sphingomonas chungangi]MBA2932927.1 flagellar basal-body rod protein FlgG [Sphingomonas chungangi]MVW56547.1 flagellar basal-body rod protein FlgG [Sphingomonas chungangi]
MTTAALHVARTGLDAQQERMQVIANNIANVNTTGFKRDRANFETLSYQYITAPGATSSGDDKYTQGTALGGGVKLAGTSRSDTQGSINQTGNALDVAIQGSGFFQIQQPDGTTAYTRDGNFSVSAEGQIVTQDGRPLVPNIQIPDGATNITIGADGTVSATTAGSTASTQLGKIQLASFVNPSGLQAVGNNMLIETDASGNPQQGDAGTDGRGTIEQGSLEASNVNVVEELVDMIETQRAYEVNSKMIKATDEMLQFANQNM